MFFLTDPDSDKVCQNIPLLLKFWNDLIITKDINKNINMIKYAKQSNIQSMLTDTQKLELLTNAAHNFGFDLFRELFLVLNMSIKEVQDLIESDKNATKHLKLCVFLENLYMSVCES